MKRLIVTGLSLLGLTAAATAADMAVKAPPALPPAAWDWAGFYVGIDGGYSFGHDAFTEVLNGNASQTASIVTPRGGVFGGQFGYNLQFGNVVIGAEGDFQWAGQNNTTCALNCVFDFGTSEFTADTVRQRLDWFATARARLGWANDGYLLYVTAGPAWGGMHETYSHLADAIPPNTVDFHENLGGWAAGAGIEARLWGNWTAKLEYLHIDLGTATNTAALPFICGPAGPNGTPCAGPFALSASSSVRDDIIRVGLNYKIFAPAGGAVSAVALPVKAATPVWNWTGFYVGLNGGYGVAGDPFSQLATFAGAPATATFANANVAPTGGLFGGQAGYNWQTGAVVFGLEGDADWADQHGTSCGFECSTAFNPAFYTTVDQKLDWLATARGRLGWANAGTLFYATGGGAFGGVKETDALPGIPAAANFSQTRSGWTAGLGIEARLWGNWSGKLEYLHFDLGHTTNAFAFAAGPTVLSTTSTIRDDVVRVGLNYKLGG